MRPSPRARLALGLIWFAALVAIPARAQNSQPATVRYIVSLAKRSEHLVGVKILLDAGASERDLQLPVWNALYQVRDFSQYVTWVRAKTGDGHPLPVQAINKTTWHLSGAAEGAVIEYEIFADQSGPFGAQLNTAHAFFNLAEILMYLPDARNDPVAVQFTDLPPGWSYAIPLNSPGAWWFPAANYDRLVDSPVELGTFHQVDFERGGAPYRVVVDADPTGYDMQKVVSTVQRIVAAAGEWMGDKPFMSDPQFSGYVFIFHFRPGAPGNGMEHANGTAIDFSTETLANNPQAFAGLTAHEFFHLWNVKRIRPQSLEPVDYTKENYTRALWFSEGTTTTAANLILLRAGLLDETHYLKGLAAEIGELEGRPARLTQSVEESSLDAWLEKYDYYRLPTRSISYYNKGNLLGVLLDLQLREATHGVASIRDVFLWMNENYARKGQFFPDTDGVRRAAEAVSHSDLGWFFQKYVAGTDEIPWDDFFQSVGLHLSRRVIDIADVGFVATRNFDAALVVSALTPGSGAELAGLAVGDSILEINGQKADRGFSGRSADVRPGDTLRLRVRTSAGERELHWKMGSRQETELELTDLDKVTTEQKARRAAWLKGEDQAMGVAAP